MLKLMVPSSVAQAVGSVFVKLLTVSAPPVVPLTGISTSVAPVELSVTCAGFVAGAVPSIAMKMVVSRLPNESAPNLRVLL